MTARRYRISGKVQGVGYRQFAREAASRVGVLGWVRNCADGNVEAHGEGDAAALETFRRELERGPRLAWVSAVTEEAVAVASHTSFEIRG